MADLGEELEGVLDDGGSLGPLVDFNPGAGDQPAAGDGREIDSFEEWHSGLSQFGMNPVILPGVSELQASYDDEPDAPHNVNGKPGFIPSMLFAQDSNPPFLPVGPSYQLYEQGQIYAEPFLGQSPLNIHPNSTKENLAIDPQLENSGSSDYDGFQDLVGTAEAGAFILPGVDVEYGLIGMSSMASIAPMSQSIPAEHSVSVISTTSTNENGRLDLKTSNTNPTDNFSSKISKSKPKGKTPVTGSRSKYRPMGRIPLAETSGNSAGSDLDDGINLENIVGIGKGSLSMPQAFAQSVGLRREAGTEAHIDDNNFDSDETIDLEEYTAACNASVGSVGNYLSRVDFILEYEQASTETPSGITSGESSLLQPTGEESADGTSLMPSVPIKRGRGRPIVPGSKRQRRIQAMAQPDYVPPKRGRPRTNEQGQRKRVRRTKTIQPVLQSAFSPALAYTSQPGMVQFKPETPNQGVDDFSFNQIYKPVILNNEIRYTPDQFILDSMQAGKIQQIYDVELPVGGWTETTERWRLTFNLNRITPTSEYLYHELREIAEKAPVALCHDAGDQENVESDSGGATKPEAAAGARLTTDIQPLMQVPVSQKEVETAKKSIFPNQHLQIIAGDGTYHEMTHEQVLEKLLNEQDVYFRTIVWELMQKSQRMESMNFVGSWNRMSGVWEFV
ncbi:uncharacterized protein DFL_002103 [Arthrobotrys flagrans]|uniref:Uncharacterized protein n=1 Tax=Arthrobotrys flagrans TaxID=97331 RepID=A0A437AAI6_ARTFL|nr:hypothetical protein DFL_002103 [Arthrobotrys flagrans]